MSSNSIENTIEDSSSGNDEPHQPMLLHKQPSQEPVISSELEDVLSDTSLPYLKRLRRATFIELRILFKLAGPAVVVYLLNNVISMSTQILCGHLGNLELAASSLGNNGIQTFCLRPYARDGECGGDTMWPSIWGAQPLLILLGESDTIASAAGIFVYGLIPQIFAYAANFPIQKFLQSQSVIFPSAYISGGVLVVHLLLSWIAIYKLGWGLLGASLVLSLSWWVLVGAQFVYILVSGKFKHTWNGFSLQAFSGLWEFFKLSIASAVMLCLETWYYQILVLIAGLLKDAETALDSLTVCMTISGWVLMISVGFNAAASVRVSNELGAGHPKSASFSVVAVTLSSFIIALVPGHCCALTSPCDELRLHWWQHHCGCRRRTLSFLGHLYFTEWSPACVYPVRCVAVGCGWQAFVAYVNVGCYYFIGIPLGCVLGFKLDFGVKGIWSGMIGGTLFQTIILLWVTFRTDWNKEVEKATKRLNIWDNIEKPLLKD
ncbi:hypothetical protein OIU84_002175 [Salix udensis]|uniref:Protein DETOXIFICATION n=1 Tax=Salix udensis TaxID=889485 RepID=A0AAD6P4C2_9ROSI|nr:hypothetical protein OIU84_002175 [Salix udensis]